MSPRKVPDLLNPDIQALAQLVSQPPKDIRGYIVVVNLATGFDAVATNACCIGHALRHANHMITHDPYATTPCSGEDS